MIQHDISINNNFDNMVCEDCGSNHISINMYFNVWQKRWFDDDPHFWCHKCNSGDGNYCDVEWYEDGQND